MKLITLVGYYGTGSSAVTDYLTEFNNNSLIGNGYEIRFVQDPDGISDLAYHIVENNHRHNTSNAIKRFVKYLNFLNGSWYTKRYRNFFSDDFLPRSMEYVNSITELQSKTWWHHDRIERGKVFYFIDTLYYKIARKLSIPGMKSMLKNKEDSFYTAIDEDKFYSLTRQYLDDLFEMANVNNSQNLIIEQMIPPSNFEKYRKLFNNLKAIVVERDPRDLYIITRFIWKNKVVPTTTVKEFCEWYKITRKHRKHERHNKDLLFIQFEDFIYNYNDTSKKINNFLEIDEKEHIDKKKYFDPKISIKGTKLYLNKTYEQDIAYIEKELQEYLYTPPE